MRDLLDNLEPRILLLLAGSVVLVLLTAIFSYLLWPQVKSYQAVRESHEILSSVVSTGSVLEQQLAQQKQAVEALSHQLHGDMAKLPVKQMESYIIGRLQKISWDTQMELVSVKPGVGAKVQKFLEILFEVEIRGNYFAFFDWLRGINQQLGFIVVKQYQMSPMNQQDENPPLSVRLKMVAYRAEES